MKNISHPIENFEESIFAKMTALAIKHEAINLSQGFPDFDCPDFLKNNVKKYIENGFNQYANYKGDQKFRETLSKFYKDHFNLNYNSDEITITNGATQAIYIAITSLLNTEDEVILFEPYYDSYLATVEMCRAKAKFVTLQMPDFSFTEEDIQSCISDKTKVIMINTPHNPTGKIFSKQELEIIKKVAIEHDLYIISDDVYENLIFDSNTHIPIASLSEMKERVITISSAGKTFGTTGWKIGWALSSKKLNSAMRMLLQFNTFSINHPMQLGISDSFKNIDQFLENNAKLYEKKRDLLFEFLQSKGLRPYKPKGGYFIVCIVPDQFKMNDVDFCEHLITKFKVATIPLSVFYKKSKEGQKLVRFCFAKKDSTLNEAMRNLVNL